MNLSRSESQATEVSAPKSPRQSHFELFGLPESFALDLEQLGAIRQRLLGVSHPDRFGQGSDAQRRVALQMTARINEAFQTLQHPISRAAYLLAQWGVDLAVETNTRMPIDFLQEQMAWREDLEEARQSSPANRDQRLEGLRLTCAQAFGTRLSRLTNLLAASGLTPPDAGTLHQAAAEVRALMFIDKFQSEIG